jgi:hypothetical protein
MRDVYRNSVQVIGWLGEFEGTSMWFSKSSAGGIVTDYCLRDLFEEVKLAARNRHLHFDPDVEVDPGCQHRLDRGAQVLDTLSKILNSQWFHRIWVFQEVVCGSCVLMVATFNDRSQELLWDELSFYLRENNLIHIGKKSEFDRRTYGYSNACIMAGRRAIMKATSDSRSSQASLSTLLTEVSSYTRATDPRDLIYALVALSEDFSFEDLQPAYRETVESVFVEATSLVLRINRRPTTQPFDLLSFSGLGYSRQLQTLPSWVPDWTSSAHNIKFVGADKTSLPMTRLEVISERAGFNATCGMSWKPPSITTSTRGKSILSVQGMVIDNVKAVSGKYPRSVPESVTENTAPVRGSVTPLPVLIHRGFRASKQHSYFVAESELAEDCDAWIQQLEKLASSVSPYPTGESSDEILWRTLIADSRQDSRPWDATFGTTCLPGKNQHLRFFEAISGKAPAVKIPSWTANKIYAAELARERAREGFENFLTAFERHGAGRVLFTTTRGYIGLGPPGTMVGKNVCLIFGAHVPFLLGRPSSRLSVARHTLVGECYVRGMMHGEGLKHGKAQENKARIVKL